MAARIGVSISPGEMVFTRTGESDSARPRPRLSSAALLQGCINAALESLGRGLALALSPARVNTISPGLIDTPIRAGMPADKKKAMLDHAAATLPARHVGQAEDVADAILMVMTNPFMTGSTLFIDGGGMIS